MVRAFQIPAVLSQMLEWRVRLRSRLQVAGRIYDIHLLFSPPLYGFMAKERYYFEFGYVIVKPDFAHIICIQKYLYYAFKLLL